ncbi:putative transcription factor interactor and regulator CCHC(Zn) family [Helianthus annuus]|nr:putative transcription factor interactor and regulator CCHC(Zn) family [Helianthus annuus]KAJ0719751.1 putative transcription factor interactor and regulator CCHC(Zn) family [Helianthus annuus]
MILKNNNDISKVTLDWLIEKLEGHDLEIQKQNKMANQQYQQNVDLYYRRSMMDQASKTTFSAGSSKESSQHSFSKDPGYHSFASNSSNPNIVQCNIAIGLKNSQSLNAEAAKQQMVFLAFVLELYESLIAGKVGNPNMTKEYYHQIDPKEMELIDIKWCMASTMRRAQRFLEITGRSCLGTADTKLGFDKLKVTCFKCKQKGHFKRECTNMQTDEVVNPFKDDYYQKAIYHRNSESSKVNQKQIDEGSSKEKSRALVVIQDDEGYDWIKVLPEEDYVGSAFVAEVVDDKRWQRDNASFQIRKLYAPFKEAQKAKRWDAERECYLDPQGNPVVGPKKVDFDAVANLFPDCDTFHTRRLSEKDYEANLYIRLKEVFEESLPKVLELRKKKEEEIEKLVEEVKKTAGDADENEQKNDEV